MKNALAYYSFPSSYIDRAQGWYICIPYFIKYSAHFFYTENDAEIFPAHYTWKVAEKGCKMAFMMNKIAMIHSCEIILEK